jgi:hypothetical protein
MLGSVHIAPLKSYLSTTLAVCLIFTPASAEAIGWLYFDPINLEAEIRFESFGNKVDRNSGRGSSTQSSLLLEERLNLELFGYAIDPRISRFSILLQPIFRQGKENQNDDSDTLHGNDLDYNIEIGFLEGAQSEIDIGLRTSSATSANDLAFGSRNKSKLQRHGLTINWKNRWFPLTFKYTRGSLVEEFTRLDGFKNGRDEDRDEIHLSGRSSKLNLALTSENVDDNVFGRDYQINRALLNHNLLWGNNSGLRSAIRAFERKGYITNSSVNWDENLMIHHKDNLTSNTSFRLFTTKANEKNTGQEGGFSLQHQLYSNLSSNVFLRGRSESSDLFKRKEYEMGARANYTKIFSFGSFSAGLFGNYGYTDRVSESGSAEALNEEHVANFIQLILLEKQFIDNSTIIVTADDGFVYSEGLDYEVRRLGIVFSELRIKPSGRIKDGELLLVSYLYETLPSGEYNSFNKGYSFSYSLNWFRFYHNAFDYNHSLVSGFGTPPDQKDRATGIELNWNLSNAIFRFRVESRFLQQGGFKSENIVLTESLNFPLGERYNINISSTQLFNKNRGAITSNPLQSIGALLNKSRTEYYSFKIALSWHAGRNLTITPSLGVWNRKQESLGQTPRDENNLFYSAELRASWQLRKLTLNFYYDHNANHNDINDITGNRLMFSIRRLFR